MRAAGLTLLAQPWIRHRQGMRFTVAALAGLLLASRLPAPDLGDAWWTPAALAAAVLSAASAFILNSVLLMEREGDLASGYPRRLFALPASTPTLVFGPMLRNVATVAALWLLTASVFPYPSPIPVVVPVLALSAAVSWLQAMVWCPFGAGWYRTVVCLIVYLVLVTPPVVLEAAYQLNPPWAPLMLVYTAVAWGVAYWAVANARRGDVWTLRLPGSRFVEAALNGLERRRGFRSPASAQFWFEARCQAGMLPLLTFWFLVFFGGFMAFLPEDARLVLPASALLGLAAATPILLAPTAGLRFGRFEPFWRTSETSIEFAGTRPTTTQALVVAKLRNAWASVVLTWAVAAVLVVAAVVASGSGERAVESARIVLGRYHGWRTGLLVGLALIAAPALTWRNLTGGLAASLCGRRWIAEAYSWTFAASMTASALPLLWFFSHREAVPVLVRSFPWFVVGLAPIKAGAAAIGFRAAVGRGLVDGRYVAAALAVWLLTGLSLGGFAWLAVAPFGPPFSGAWFMAAGLIVAPLGRIAVAPLALDWNRHR